MQRFGIRRLEALVIALVALVGGCFAVEMFLLKPDWGQVGQGFIPQAASLRDGQQLFLAAGILGATVMPHNLYLHSSLVQSRRWSGGQVAQRRALAFSTWDTLIALSLAFLINVSILVLAAGSFYGRLPQPVTDLSEAYRLLTPMLGTSLASVLFGVALLAAGQSSTLTATNGRPDREGGVSADPAARLEATTAHPRPGPDPGDGHSDPVRRTGHHESAGAQPGGAVAAVAVRCDPAGVVLRAARSDGRAQSAARSAGRRLAVRQRDCDDQPLVAQRGAAGRLNC